MDNVVSDTNTKFVPPKRRRTQSCTKIAIKWGITTVEARNLCEIIDKQQGKALTPPAQIMTEEEHKKFVLNERIIK